MSISVSTPERDKRDKKLRAEKSILKVDISVKKKPKAEKEKKVEKPVISLAKLRTVYGVLYEETFPEVEDEKKERKQLISAIKKKLK